METVENMFERIQDSFDKSNKPTGGGMYKDFLYFEKGKDYIVRLLPFAKAPEDTIYSFKCHKWKSNSTGKYVEYLDPTMWDSPNPISQYSRKKWNEATSAGAVKGDPRLEELKKIFPKDQFLINCYVITDPTNPDNEGQVKILRMGKQLHDIVNQHFLGERKDEFGIKIVDPSAKGCNLKIKVEDNGGGYPKYDKSYFMSSSEIEGVSQNPDKIRDIFDQCHNLKEIFPTLSYEDLKKEFEMHWLCNDENNTVTPATKPEFNAGKTDISSMIEETSKETKVTTPQKEESVEQKSTTGELDIDAMLAELD